MDQQTNQFDKIFKENIEVVIPGLLEKVLDIHVAHAEELPDDLQHTRERRPDLLKKITDINGETFVLQLEFQVADEPEMVYRMLEYVGLLARIYKLPVRQFVLFIGGKKPKMATRLEFENLHFRYVLLPISSIDYRIFLESTRPEEVVFGILSHFDKEQSEETVKKFIHRLRETSPGQLAFQKYIGQLRILAKLRKLQSLIDTVMLNISQYINEEEDAFFIKGEQKGEVKGEKKAKEKIALNLLQKKEYSDSEIAEITELSLESVQDMRKKLGQNPV